MKRYILFDLDGTLTDPKEGITKSVQYALAKLGIEEDSNNLTKFIGPPLKESFSVFYGFDREKAEKAVKFYRERYADVGIFENKVIEDIPQLLKSLKEAGKVLAVATSKPTKFAKAICDKYDLSQYFDLILGSELDGTRSNKDEVIKEVLNRLGSSKEETIMIGDRRHDIIGAKKCDIASVGVEFGYAEEGELQKAGADYIVKKPSELLFLI